MKSLFGSKLSNCSFEFLESVYTQLVSPTLPPGEAFNGMMFYTTFRDKIVYVRPQDQVIPLPPPVTKSKKKARASQDSDESTASEFGTERSAGEDDDEILRIRGLFTSESSSTTAVDSIPETSLSESLVSQSSNQHINSNNTVRVQEILPVDSIPESSVSESLVSQSRNQHSNSDNTDRVQETPRVIDLTTEYMYAAMFDTEPDEIFSDLDEIEVVAEHSESEGIDPQPTSEEILRRLARIINFDEISKFNISRSNLWESAVRGFNRKSFSPTKKISVKFMDDIGQPGGAIDAGGPRREFLTLILEHLRNSPLFIGKNHSKFLTCLAQNMEDGDYFLAGQVFAMTLVHGGPPPQFLAPQVFESLIQNPNKQKGTIDDIYDLEFKNLLESLLNSQDVNRINDILSEHASLFEFAGTLRQVRNLEDRDKLVNQTINWFLFGKTRPALEALKEGMKTLGILEQIETYPKVFEPLFIYKHKKLTADEVTNLFQVKRSLPGSNKFEDENLLLSFWNDLLIDIEEGESELTLEMVLSFATGCPCVPPIGFSPIVPAIAFLHDLEADGNKSKFPKANTCALKLYLPTVHSKYNDFKNAMAYGIMNTKGFGYY